MSKFDVLCDKIRGFRRLAIAFSGGTDSTFLAAAAGKCLPKDDILLLHIDSVLLPPSDRGFAAQWAAKNDFRLETVAFDPLGDTEIAANDRLRCYYCKKRVFSELYAHARRLGFETLADGANCDDLGDYRPGMDAARELGIAHPLLDCGFSKRDIRYFARELGLVNADAPSSACLASRIPTGTPLTRKALRMAGDAESILIDLGFCGIRVRVIGPLAKIEASPSDMPRMLDLRKAIADKLMRLGFAEVTLDLNGYRMGSMNQREES